MYVECETSGCSLFASLMSSIVAMYYPSFVPPHDGGIIFLSVELQVENTSLIPFQRLDVSFHNISPSFVSSEHIKLLQFENIPSCNVIIDVEKPVIGKIFEISIQSFLHPLNIFENDFS